MAGVTEAASSGADALKMPPPESMSNGTASSVKGNDALKEVLVPWLVVGAKRDGSSWLTSQHGLFV